MTEPRPDLFRPLKLIPWQEEVERAVHQGAKYIYLKCGRKAGKSEYAMYRGVKEAFNPADLPDITTPIIGPERIHAKKIYWRRLQHYVAPCGNWAQLLLKRPNQTELYMDFKSNVRLSLEGAENEKIIRGWNIRYPILDEADEMKSSFYEEVIEPNTLATGGAGGLFLGTPKNRWFTKLWRLASSGGLGREHAAFKFTPYDNPHISAVNLEAIKGRISREIWEQEYMANEAAFTGTKYHEFDGSQIVAHREPKGPKFARFIDWGWDHPSVCLWAELYFNEEKKRWMAYIFNELFLKGRDIEELVSAIKAGDGRQYVINVIDKSARRHEMASGTSILNEFRRAGLSCMPCLKTEDFQVNALKMMLKRCDIQISDSCRTLIRQLREVEWGQKENDDATDALKYGAAMIYERDFTNIDSMEGQDKEVKLEVIDPNGLLAEGDRGEASWVANW